MSLIFNSNYFILLTQIPIQKLQTNDIYTHIFKSFCQSLPIWEIISNLIPF